MPVSVPSLRAPISSSRHLRRGRVRGLEVLAAREHEADRPSERERRARRERLDERELAAERASERLGDDPDPARAAARRRGRAPRGVTNEPCVLVGDDERARRLEPRRRHLRLDVRLVDPRRPERPLDDGVARRERRRRRRPARAWTRSSTLPGELLLVVVRLAVVDAGVDRLEVAAVRRPSPRRARERARRPPSRPRRRRPPRAARSRRRPPLRRPRRRPRSRRRRARPAGRRRRPPRARAARPCGRCPASRSAGRPP